MGNWHRGYSSADRVILALKLQQLKSELFDLPIAHSPQVVRNPAAVDSLHYDLQSTGPALRVP